MNNDNPHDQEKRNIERDQKLVDIANRTINDWLESTRGLPITIQLNKLGFAVIAALEESYELGKSEVIYGD